MYVYSLFNFDFDDSQNIKIIHNKKFNKEEFEYIVNSCTKKYLSLKKENHDKLSKYLKNQIQLSDKEAEYCFNITSEFNKIENIANILKEDYGFYFLDDPIYTFTFNKFNAEKGSEPYNKVD